MTLISLGLESGLLTLGQSLRWTLTPCPVETKPMMSSPGIGVHQLAKEIMTVSPFASKTTSLLFFLIWRWLIFLVISSALILPS